MRGCSNRSKQNQGKAGKRRGFWQICARGGCTLFVAEVLGLEGGRSCAASRRRKQELSPFPYIAAVFCVWTELRLLAAREEAGDCEIIFISTANIKKYSYSSSGRRVIRLLLLLWSSSTRASLDTLYALLRVWSPLDPPVQQLGPNSGPQFSATNGKSWFTARRDVMVLYWEVTCPG